MAGSANQFPGVKFLTYGRPYNYFNKLGVSWTSFGGNSIDGYQPDMLVPFKTQGLKFYNVGSGVIEYSFDGITVHGELNSANATASIAFDFRIVSCIWFRVQTGSSGTITVEVHAWAQQT